MTKIIKDFLILSSLILLSSSQIILPLVRMTPTPTTPEQPLSTITTQPETPPSLPLISQIPNLLNNIVFTPTAPFKDFELMNDNPSGSISGVILSFRSNFSYDELFSKVEQKSKQGTVVLVYSANSNQISNISDAFNGNFTNANQLMRDMVTQIRSIGAICPNCIIFNWECSSGYSSQDFKEGKATVMNFLKFILDKGYMGMFSDFSLKALIHEWDSSILGNNPFVKIGETLKPIQLKFDPLELTRSPSSQLQIVGELATSGNLEMSTLGGTIIYSVNSSVPQNNFYSLKVLTIATNETTLSEELKLNIGNKIGTAGHVILTYKSGGHLLTSMGHWIELMKIDTSEHKLFEVASRRYGTKILQELKNQYTNLTDAQKAPFLQKNAINFIQNQSPGLNYAYIEP